MKIQALRAFQMLTLLLMLGVTSAHALTGDKVVANIPFDFTVEKTTLPAGEYTIVRSGSSLVLFVQNKETHEAAFVQAIPVEDRSSLGEAKLVFVRHGNEHFLSQVWFGTLTGREIPKPRMESLSMYIVAVTAWYPRTVPSLLGNDTIREPFANSTRKALSALVGIGLP